MFHMIRTINYTYFICSGASILLQALGRPLGVV